MEEVQQPQSCLPHSVCCKLMQHFSAKETEEDYEERKKVLFPTQVELGAIPRLIL